jgi:hypothetical protein
MLFRGLLGILLLLLLVLEPWEVLNNTGRVKQHTHDKQHTSTANDKQGLGSEPAAAVFSSSILRALHDVVAKHPSEYFRALAQVVLAAPNVTSASRLPYDCGQGISTYPISFSIPYALFHQHVPAKAQNFSSVIPGLARTYR